MNNRLYSIVAVFAVAGASGFAFGEQLDHWEYDSTAKTITDNVWTLSASVISGKMTVESPVSGGYPTDPSDPQELNFAKTIQKAGDSSTTYEIYTLNFASASVDSGNGKSITPYAWAGCIGRLVFPSTGSCKFTSFKDGAFAGATNLTEIVNFLPDEITTLGHCSFRKTAAAQPLYLKGVVTCTVEHPFSDSAITSVTFGPKLATLGGGNVYDYPGSFTSKNLATINFDPAMSNATMTGYAIFKNSTSLQALPDLKGFSKLNCQSPFSGCGLKVGVLKIHSGVTSMNCLFMSGLSVTNLVFEGLPPTAFPMGKKGKKDTYYLNNGTVLTTYIPEKYKNDWATWTAGNEVVDDHSTTWCQAVAGANYAKFPLIYEAKAGELGDWIYDAATHTVTDGTWVFAATNSGTQVTVYKWITYPSVPTELDFTGTLTDTQGYPYVFVALNTQFGRDDERHWIKGEGLSYATEASGSVSSLKYPDSVISFGAQAFGSCTNLASVTPMFGDWVTSIGSGAFSKTGITGDLKLMGLSGVGYGSFYRCTNLTSVTFGPKLTSFYSRSAQNAGNFQGCTALTNVTFDANMAKCQMGNDQDGYGNHFYGCTNLTGTLDLSGFNSLGFTRSTDGSTSLTRAFSGTRYDNVIIATNIVRISRNVFSGMNCLTNVTFLAGPPSNADSMSAAGFAIYGAMTNRITTTINREFRNQWTNYVDIASRCWKSDYLATGISPSQRPVLIPDLHGLIVILR